MLERLLVPSVARPSADERPPPKKKPHALGWSRKPKSSLRVAWEASLAGEPRGGPGEGGARERDQAVAALPTKSPAASEPTWPGGQRKQFFGIEAMKSCVSLAKAGVGGGSPGAERVPGSSRQGYLYPEAHTHQACSLGLGCRVVEPACVCLGGERRERGRVHQSRG